MTNLSKTFQTKYTNTFHAGSMHDRMYIKLWDLFEASRYSDIGGRELLRYYNKLGTFEPPAAFADELRDG